MARRNWYDQARLVGDCTDLSGYSFHDVDCRITWFAYSSEPGGIAQEVGYPEHVRPSGDTGSAGWMLQDGACTHMPRDRWLEMELHAEQRRGRWRYRNIHPYGRF